MQLDLFDDRHQLLVRARKSVAELRLGDARHELIGLCNRYPADPGLAAELARVQRLMVRMTDVELAAEADLPAALLELAAHVDGAGLGLDVRLALLRRVGETLSNARGDAGLLNGQPPGYYFLLGSDIAAARASLEAAVALERRARFLALLGDAEPSRTRYAEALLLDPYDVAIDRVADDEVRSLPDVARFEMGLEADPIAWAGPTGIVTGVLPGVAVPVAAADGELGRARAFATALARGSVADRKEMKRLAPELFAAYLEGLSRR